MSVFKRAGFVPPQDCNLLIQEFHAVVDNGNCRKHTYRTEVVGRYMADLLRPIRDSVQAIIRDGFDVPVLFPELTIMSQMRANDSHVLHADNVTLAGTPNHTPWRNYTAMVYLNNYGRSFVGGNLFFPKLDIDIEPATGLLVMFPCDLEHQHEVPIIITGERYSISIWFTTDSSRMEQW